MRHNTCQTNMILTRTKKKPNVTIIMDRVEYNLLGIFIRKAVKQEQIVIQDSASFSSDLKDLVADVKQNNAQCHELLEKVQALTENSEKRNDTSVQVREAQITGTIKLAFHFKI